MKYRKKPVIINAIQYDGKNFLNILSTLNTCQIYQNLSTNELSIDTLEGKMIAKEGDYIIKGVKGELYPCKPEIFELTYEAVADETQKKESSEKLAFLLPNAWCVGLSSTECFLIEKLKDVCIAVDNINKARLT